eukprot:m.314079 g.314079  ORF g.314079 m.314079 type:complete len:188 (+) comp20263_c0_seq25:972-1535(+)
MMLSDSYYGAARALLVNGMQCVALAGGGAAAGALYYFGDISLADNMLILLVCQATVAPCVVAVVYFVTVVPSTTSALKGAAAGAEEERLLASDHADDRTEDRATSINTPLAEDASRGKAAPGTSGLTIETTAVDNSWSTFLHVSFTSWKCYHVLLIMVLKVRVQHCAAHQFMVIKVWFVFWVFTLKR